MNFISSDTISVKHATFLGETATLATILLSVSCPRPWGNSDTGHNSVVRVVPTSLGKQRHWPQFCCPCRVLVLGETATLATILLSVSCPCPMGELICWQRILSNLSVNLRGSIPLCRVQVLVYEGKIPSVYFPLGQNNYAS